MKKDVKKPQAKRITKRSASRMLVQEGEDHKEEEEAEEEQDEEQEEAIPLHGDGVAVANIRGKRNRVVDCLSWSSLLATGPTG